MDRLTCDRMFIAVFETGSFVGGSDRMGTSAGQASKLIGKLEGDLGARLFNRTTRAVTPTEVGRAYYDRLRPLMDEYDTLDQSVRDASRMPRGRLRLTAPQTFGAMELAPALSDFARLYPEISLEVDFSDRVVSLVDEGYDAAIRVGRPVDSSLIARKLCDSRIVAVAAPDYLDRRGTPALPADLAGHDCIIDRNFRDPHHWPFQDGEEAVQIPVKGRLSFSNAEACVLAAIAGHGIANTPEFVAAKALRDGRLVPVLADFMDSGFAVYAIYPPGRHLAVKVRVLVDFLTDRFRNPPWQ